MPIVGFNYSKVEVEKKDKITNEKVNIKSDVGIKDIKEEKLPTGKTKADGLRFDFEYNVSYNPGLGSILLKGFIYYMDDAKIIKDILAGWKKDKSVPNNVTLEIINAVLFKSTVKALALAQEVNLPPHIPIMPKAMINPTKSKDYIG